MLQEPALIGQAFFMNMIGVGGGVMADFWRKAELAVFYAKLVRVASCAE